MKRYVIKRTLMLIFLLYSTALLVFIFLYYLPGDPSMSILTKGYSLQDIQRFNTGLSMDKPLLTQFLGYHKQLLNLDFGISFFNHKAVTYNIMAYLPNTLRLAAASMTLALLLSFPIGTLAAFNENTPLDSMITFANSVILALPVFLLGPLLIVLFSIKLELLPVSGSTEIKYIILPALTLGISMSAPLTRIIRVSVCRELKQEYVLLANAKGLSQYKIFVNHILKNAMIPIITTIGLQTGALLTGVIITESIFSWQGIGTLLFHSIKRRDYPTVQGIVLLITFFYLVINFLTDISYFYLEPGIRYGIKKK
ncbi:MAG: ABC transporter permease [bacterium]|nr:ABC transporter permease [bacterium]